MLEQNPLAQVDDEDLASRMMKGDQEALRAAIKMYGAKVKGYLKRQFGDQLDENERDDVFQKSLIKFWNKISTFDRSKGTLRGWWIRIVHNKALDQIEGADNYRAKYKAADLDDQADDGNDLCDGAEVTEDSKELKRLERVYGFIHNNLVGDERTVAVNCFAIGGDPDIVRLAAKLGRSRAYIDTVKSKVKRKIREFVLTLEAEDGRKEVQ